MINPNENRRLPDRYKALIQPSKSNLHCHTKPSPMNKADKNNPSDIVEQQYALSVFKLKVVTPIITET